MSKPPTSESLSRRLEKAALDYLARFSASTESLRRVLARKVSRLGLAEEEGQAPIEAVIEKLVRLGYVDDRLYAEGHARSLSRRGRPVVVIRRALANKGVEGEAAEAALAALAEESGEAVPDLAAARALVRRRRMGPWRQPGERAAMRERDLARLARAGFSWQIAKAALEEEEPD